MKTQLFKTYSRASKSDFAESIFVGATDQQAFAHRSELRDFGNSTIVERSFAWMPNDKRTLRIFGLPNGDIGFRSFGSGVGDEKIASRVFSDQEEAISYLNSIANTYIGSDKGWKEV